MNVCLIGDSLTSLALAKNLVNKGIKVCLYYKSIKKNKHESRTIGISENNFQFFDKEIISLKKQKSWRIKKIQIYNEKYKNNKILSFEKSQKTLFRILKNKDIYEVLNKNLKKNKLFKKIKMKKDFLSIKNFKNDKYNLIINCDLSNDISKLLFSEKINKDYNSKAYTTILKHKNINNKEAIQIFTKFGPIAFLPFSNSETSVVFSIINKKKELSEKEILNLIIYYNNKYNIKSFSNLEKFPLNFSFPKNYYHKNIMCFGDSLHKIHPIAGQGFNMILRDIKNFSNIIDGRINLGLQLDFSIYKEFEKSTKHINFAFSSGIDLIYEFFKFDNKNNNNYSNYLLKTIGRNNFFNKVVTKIADKGLTL